MDQHPVLATVFGNGLINHTWKLNYGAEAYILQTINQLVFTDPWAIASNIDAIAQYLLEHHPQYLFVTPKQTKQGASMLVLNGVYYRIFPFVKDSVAKTVLETPEQAFEAARQFGLFTKNLAGFDCGQLKTTLPKFHDLVLRDQQFLDAVEHGNQERKNIAKGLIDKLVAYRFITHRFAQIISNPNFKIRPTHHDTKISNVLFNSQDKAICVIDLDTLMPGYFISDLGDMMRTYLCPVSEEESDFNKIGIRKDFYDAVIDGYCSEMGNELSKDELDAIPYAGQFMVYMQALRFLTDYLNNDVYYGAKYPDQNLVRAGNQLVLLEKLLELAI
ncbi:MAG: aminoglycoside phosphotransferase [Chitinophagaceae bacterium BSSC1]|nr:MAG: aminoglycoside phosphotransferase [Chitinophagaceae bacterium BSSC1]